MWSTYALVDVIPDLVAGSVEGHFEADSTSEHGGNEDRVLLEDGVVDSASDRHGEWTLELN